MITIKVKDILPDFAKYSETITVKRIKEKMLLVCDEQPEYVADELLLLSEEILSQVAAYGVCLYLQKGGALQTEKNNDYILHDLFLHEGHQNAGPVFYRICGVINDIKENLSASDIELFNHELNKESVVYKDLKKLADFRNALMHGFFKLPASENLKIIGEIQQVLEKLSNEYKIFEHKTDFHFWKKEGFTGHWKMKGNSDLSNLAGDVSPFEKLASKANDELHSANFVNAISIDLETATDLEQKEKVDGFIAQDNTNNSVNSNVNDKAKKKPSNLKESLYVQFHPRDKKQQDEFYKSAYALLSQKKDVELLACTIDENGIGYTSYLLFERLLQKLSPVKATLKENYPNKEELQKKDFLSAEKPKDKPKDKVKSLISDIRKLDKEKSLKIVILINNIHLVPFASDHITSLMKFYKDSGIYFIGIGWEYEHLNSIFSQKIDLRKEKNIIPDDTEIEFLIKNHARHRGPYENEKDYAALKSLIHLISKRLKSKNPVIARQLADEESLDIELINEALYILYPHCKYGQSGDDTNYIKDDLDELYGFPKNQTETSSIFLTLGRRDIELEYKHKILKP